eukprot:CAMPEP_0178956732 /NCGR_PEP_ID=MMETSP0789-20121207/10453_1 /TAXON_ID=3005 /ORGANISM="Rhizosolenia setigera, Strain CCMP 1694" /LENGTH=503 /DNA_ID=CAMNT_0020638765 /DNA_START=139 /DNA_END=1650 /DNA_ORIENTATION=-
MGKKSRRNRPTRQQERKQNNVCVLSSPYLRSRSDFRRVPRWSNDGIEQQRQRYLSGEDENHKCDTNDPDHIDYVELLGGYPCDTPLNKLNPDTRSFFLGLPHQFQEKAAKEQSDLSSAKDHLICAYKRGDTDVLQLLDDINCRHALYKASTDSSRFPSFHTILVPLFQRNLASDCNIEILFGKVSYVRHLLLDIGPHIFEPPPLNSPAGAFLSQFYYNPEVRAPPIPKSCAGCKSVSVDCQKCVACKSVHYCSVACQREHWPIHRPQCLRAQGKDVPKKFLEKAVQAQKKRDKIEIEKKEQMEVQKYKEFHEALMKFREEPPALCNSHAHDCMGKRLLIHVPSVNANNIIAIVGGTIGLSKVEDLSMNFYPDGIDPDKYGYRGLHFRDDNNGGARVIVLFERLFENEGEGLGVGLHIDGMFVVDEVLENRAKWKLVKEPKHIYQPNHTRLSRLTTYLEQAKMIAKAVPETVDLCLGYQGDPKFSTTPTAFGDYLSDVDGFTMT